MKKKLLGLLLVLCLVVALIPIATMAATPAVTVTLGGVTWTNIEKGTHKYAITTTTTDAGTGRVTGTVTECESTADWNIHLDYSDNTPVLYLKNATISNTETLEGSAITYGGFVLKVETDGAFVVNSMEGTTNSLLNNSTLYHAHPMNLQAKLGTTITGTGKLIGTSAAGDASADTIGTKYDLTFDHADVELTNLSNRRNAIGFGYTNNASVDAVDGKLTIDGGNVVLRVNGNGSCIYYVSHAYNAGDPMTQNLSPVTIKGGANVKLYDTGNEAVIRAVSGINILDYSSLEMTTSNLYNFPSCELPVFPETTGNYLVEYKLSSDKSTTYSFMTSDTTDPDYIAGGTDMTQTGTANEVVNDGLSYLKISHQHAIGGDCTVGGTCPECNSVVAPLANHVFADFDADTCSNSGCTVTRPAGLRATISGVVMDTAHGETKYATMAADGAVALVDASAAWNIKIDYTGDVPVLSLQNITATPAANTFQLSGKDALIIKNLTDVTLKVNGANNAFVLNMEDGTTFTSEGTSMLKLDFNGNSAMEHNIKVMAGNLTFKDANIDINSGRSSAYTPCATINAVADVIFIGGNAEIDGSGGSNAIDVGGDLIIKDLAKVTLISSGWGYVANVTGDIKIDTADLAAKITWGSPSADKWVFNKVPAEMVNVNAVYSTSQWNYNDPAYQKALTATTNILDWENNPIFYIGFSSHVHDTTTDCTVAYTCSCGETVPAKAAHTFDNDCTTADTCKYCVQTATAGAHKFDADCTTADTCQNAGCEQTTTAAAAHAFDNDCTTADKCANCDVKADAKAAHEFDNDCMTADKCANCDQVATAGVHTFDADCTTDDTCSVCSNAKAEKKDAHVFDNDCTTADTCQNAGCAVKAEAQAAHKFDNDCNTADKCANCDQVAIAGAHTFDNDCTTDDTCSVCGNVKAEKKDAHVFDNDCTTADTCTNAGCAVKAEAKAAHVFDNDCTTADKCANCEVKAEAKAAHAFDADCTTDDKCANCDVKAEKKAAHAFDSDCTTADKCANCDVKAQAGAHVFDKDCTTADKCASCGTAATAEKAHKYTNNADTTCDNAGCEHTRVVESGDKNPQTGDNTALVLCVVVLLTSAAAFVFTKKRIAL